MISINLYIKCSLIFCRVSNSIKMLKQNIQLLDSFNSSTKLLFTVTFNLCINIIISAQSAKTVIILVRQK